MMTTQQFFNRMGDLNLAVCFDPATAIIGAGVLGLGGSVLGANAANKGANTAANATRDATNASIASQERIYNQGREDMAPYRDLAPQSLATLQSSIYGTPQSYQDPSYRQATADDIAKYNESLAPGRSAALAQVNGLPTGGMFGDLRNKALSQIGSPDGLLDTNKTYYIGADGKPIEQSVVPQLQTQGQQFDLKNFTPENTAAFDWQKSRTLEDLGNYFNLVGRGKGSTVQSNATGRALGDLNASEYEKGYNRLFQRKQDYTNDLLNLVKTAQGAAGTTTSLGAQTAGNVGQAYQQQGNTLANLANQQGQTQANLYSGVVPSIMNTSGTGMQLNSYLKNNQTPDLVDPFGTNWGQ